MYEFSATFAVLGGRERLTALSRLWSRNSDMARQLANNVVESLRTQPLVLALVLINVIVVAGFAFTQHEVSKSIERKDTMLQSCIERR
ncbi:hypothetical protein [Bradyrhizobium sp. CB2312]|uniref:hypothetical protein n=1 Tax=Bradyrhizobium sp. CB2312 TaxID=3039155 RepID=UPI0024B0968F|nr:hypothetical protein [Bradyrhizobium sp. CB2312]WFU75497.1 hypothetical protein QA642_16530 [Bradyrhizobium sp. CB2312]